MQKNIFNRSPSMVQLTPRIEPPQAINVQSSSPASTTFNIIMFGPYQTGKTSLIQTLRAFLRSKLVLGGDQDANEPDLDPENPQSELLSQWKERITVDGQSFTLILRKLSELVEVVSPSSNRQVDPSAIILQQIKDADGF